MLCMLLAYDTAGEVVATLDHLVRYDEEGNVLGLVDFEATEENGGEVADFWRADSGDPGRPVKGAKAWPEWLGGRAHEFRVVLAGPPGQKRIAALVHKNSGHRRSREAVEATIAARLATARALSEARGFETPADIRDLVGGPERPIQLDENGKTKKRPKAARSRLPVVRISPKAGEESAE